MNGRLLFLNTMLAAALLLVCWRLWANYSADNAQREAFLRRGASASDVPAHTPSEEAKPVSASSFLEVAQNMLFARDRNSNVIIEIEAPPPPPPPPPVPPFPAAYGKMDLAGDTVIVLGTAGKQKGYRLGDAVGEFKLAAIRGDELTFEWQGQEFKKTMEELRKLAPKEGSTTSAPPPAAAAAKPSATLSPAEASAEVVRQQVTAPEVRERELRQGNGPGFSAGFGQDRACDPADPSPAGTVQGGYRKRITATPFGNSCIWEPVRQ